ncbi:flagellar basal body-associated FliL family protein [Mariprofundus erugo]|uniref:flagellar basal body-associated FliL family protein n=1 Tax=Mariprofundus erugo TaxID=2528639 RepID=UPI0010FD2D7C|nr:flagellar basal body-associated FliL family protein [Mariprofundus erugo]TLS78430.1 flagellar basal body-associated FliL family protein [Mariprofundus erugo]
MAEDAKEEKGKSSGGLLPIINLALLVLVLAVGGFIAWKLMSMEQPTADADKKPVTQTEETALPEAEEENAGPPIMIDIDNITVNLADTDESRFLRTKIKLEVRSEEAKTKVTENMVKINDLIITMLASKTFAEIRTPQGKYALKEDMVYRLNRIVGGKPIKNLYFTDFVSQ